MRTPAFLIATLLTVELASAAEPVDYLREIKPLFKKHCYACHGGLKQEAGLRLDTAELARKGGESGPAVISGRGTESLILKRVLELDGETRMPPEGEGEPFSPKEIQLIKLWIEQGAKAPADEQPEAPQAHWAFRAPVRPDVPTVRNMTWARNPIDAFIAARHEAEGLMPQPPIARSLLLRRVYLDLIGLPPTYEQQQAFLADTSPDAYEKVVDRLLESPLHGERWGRHWMDIWRYSDWWGLGDQLRNSQKHIWHWRDWIIESLNDDTPYDEMVHQMLAADELYPNDLGKLRATGYLARNYFIFNRPQWMEETVEHVSKGFLGLTMNCTKCHDHKFDPFEQTDFYRMRAFFEPYHVRLDVVPGESNLDRDGIPRVFDGLPDKPTYLYVRGDEKNPDKSTVIEPGVPKLLEFDELKIEPVSLPVESWKPEQRPWVAEAFLKEAKEKLQLAEAELQKASDDMQQSDSQTEEETSTTDADAAASKAAFTVAEANLELAKAELAFTEARIQATKAGEEARQALAIAAVKAERQMGVAKSHHALAVAEQASLRAAEDKKEEAEKKVKAAEEALAKAETAAATEIKPDETYTPLTGAKWTATRFMESRTDDPTVEFQPESTGRRTALARWMTDRRNPLTARVAVNHIWMHHIGQPLVATVFDFGRNGAEPTHPELLDWLAVELMESGWSMKHLHRLIVTSATYRMSSSMAGAENNLAIDRDNRFLWRRVPMRLESQVVRDSLLAMAGTLDLSAGGPPVPSSQQANSTRRSLYFFHSNNDRNLFLTKFDEALVKECYRREQSIVPQQALALTNSELVLTAAEKIARRLSTGSDDDLLFIDKAFAAVLGTVPTEAELEAARTAIEEWKTLPGGSAERARTNLVWALINHNDFVTVR